jgi:hypothetical protein
VDSWVIWATIFAVGGGYELWTIFNKQKGDTLTEKVRRLYRIPVVKYLGTAFVVWLGLHFLQLVGA